MSLPRQMKGALRPPAPVSASDLLTEARQILWTSDSREDAQAVLERIDALPTPRRVLPKRVKLDALKTLAQWRLTGDIIPNYQNVNEARIQLWEIERDCPVFEFQKQFLARITRDYRGAKGPRRLAAVYQSLQSVQPAPFISPSDGVCVIRRPEATHTFIVFLSLPYLVSNLTPCLLDRAIAQPLNANVIICFDKARLLYLGGIGPIGDRDVTIAYLRRLLDDFRDTKIIAIGGSAGVFGALHASCDLDIEHVIASSGPTSLDMGFSGSDRQVYQKIEMAATAGKIKLIDLIPNVATSAIRRVDFFVAGENEYDMAQMNALRAATDVVIPHIYNNTDAHGVVDRAIVDGSLMKAVTAF